MDRTVACGQLVLACVMVSKLKLELEGVRVALVMAVACVHAASCKHNHTVWLIVLGLCKRIREVTAEEEKERQAL